MPILYCWGGGALIYHESNFFFIPKWLILHVKAGQVHHLVLVYVSQAVQLLQCYGLMYPPAPSNKEVRLEMLAEQLQRLTWLKPLLLVLTYSPLSGMFKWAVLVNIIICTLGVSELEGSHRWVRLFNPSWTMTIPSCKNLLIIFIIYDSYMREKPVHGLLRVSLCTRIVNKPQSCAWATPCW